MPQQVDVGIAVVRYPEWYYLIGRDRGERTTVLEYNSADGRAGTFGSKANIAAVLKDQEL
jgi:hypothetical protein